MLLVLYYYGQSRLPHSQGWVVAGPGREFRLQVAYLLIPEFLVTVAFYVCCVVSALGISVAKWFRGAGADTVVKDDGRDKAITLGLFLRASSSLFTFALFYQNISFRICPRYLLVIYPLLAVGFIAFAHSYSISRRTVAILLLVGIGWNLVNHDGRFYVPYPGNNGGALERSGEYHRLVQLHEKLVGFVEAHMDPNRVVVVAGWPSLHALTFPEAGYGASGRFVTYSPRPLSYAPMGTLAELYTAENDGVTVRQVGDREILWIHDPNSYTAGLLQEMMEPVQGHDVVLATWSSGDMSISLYRRPRHIQHQPLNEFLHYLDQDSLRKSP